MTRDEMLLSRLEHLRARRDKQRGRLIALRGRDSYPLWDDVDRLEKRDVAGCGFAAGSVAPQCFRYRCF